MNSPALLIPILLPAGLAIITFLIPTRVKLLREIIAVLGSIVMLYFGFVFFSLKNLVYTVPWAGLGIDFDLRLYHFSSFILLALSGFVFLITVFSTIKMAKSTRIKEYYGYLFLTAVFANGAVLANNFVPLVFFWEGLLLTLYGLITIGGNKDSHRTAVKAFLISGFCDFCMILGIGILWYLTGTLKMSQISIEPRGLAAVSFMALLPASIEKLLGIYLLARISLDFFKLQVNSPLCILLMIIGAVTIVLAVFMALVQKDFKKLLSFHAISQVGYMILGIGTGIPIGIAGGIFHMINHAMYKCGLFLSSGSVEHRAGTTELKKLGGLKNEMPITALGFTVCALAISGVWPLNGFVSKEMVFHGALETGYTIFAIAAWVGAIFTFASFLKAGHSVFLGPRKQEIPKTKESESPIFIPIIILALLCIIFGVYNKLPLKLFIEPILEGQVEPGQPLNFSAHALSLFNPVAGISILCLLIALAIHFYGWNRAGKQAHLASELIHKLPGLKSLYDWSEARIFDIYEQGIKFLRGLARILYVWIDRPIDYFYEKIVTATGRTFTGILSAAHNGNYANYLAWCIAGLIALVWAISGLLK